MSDPRLKDTKFGMIGIPIFLVIVLIVFMNLVQL